ncbi:cell division protein SepF [Candidatus Woesearchaeota archaeon]|nr:cell division protein SepF [Candidatus Woesearchaeota archaeon]
MAGFFSNIKTKFSDMFSSEEQDVLAEADKDYVELDTSASADKAKVTVRPFSIEEFADIKLILDVLRDGSTIALVNIKPLKDKDIIELKRAINKLKKTSDAIGGDIAGFGDDYVVVTPSFAQVYRAKSASSAAASGQQGSQMSQEIRVEEEAV